MSKKVKVNGVVTSIFYALSVPWCKEKDSNKWNSGYRGPDAFVEERSSLFSK